MEKLGVGMINIPDGVFPEDDDGHKIVGNYDATLCDRRDTIMTFQIRRPGLGYWTADKLLGRWVGISERITVDSSRINFEEPERLPV